MPVKISVPDWTLLTYFDDCIQPRATRSFMKSMMLTTAVVALAVRTYENTFHRVMPR